jgi:hypothetical protein
MNDAFLAWVKSPECFALLRSCANQVSVRAKRLEITLDDAYLEMENRDDFLNAVASDLTTFLLDPERAGQILRKATDMLVSNDEDAIMAFLCREYLDHYIDKRRTVSPFHIYYRRIRTVLSETDGIRYESQQRKGSFYACTQTADLNFLPDHLTRQDYSAWQVCDAVPFRDIHSKVAMLKLAHHYWDEALHEFITEYLLPIREVVKFVAVKYPLLMQMEYASEQELPDSDDKGSFLENRLVDDNAALFEDSWKRQLPVLACDIIDTQLESLAEDCVAEMTDQERIMLLHLDTGKSPNEIAGEFGLKSPYNIKNKAHEKIRMKWSLWGPPDSEHFADTEEEQYIFYEKVIGFCRTAISCRDYREGIKS